MCVRQSQIECVEMLLAREDVDVNVCDCKGRTPLHYAVENKQKRKELIEALLSHKDIEINIRDNEGKTPLDTFMEIECDGKNEIVCLFLQKGADA